MQLGLTKQGWEVPGSVEISVAREHMDLPAAKGVLTFDGTSRRRAIPTDDTFVDFLNLAEATPRQILHFARRYGSLGASYARDLLGNSQITLIGPTFLDHFDGRTYLTEVFDMDGSVYPGWSILDEARAWRGKARWIRNLVDAAASLHQPNAEVSNALWREIDDLLLIWQFRGTANHREGGAFETWSEQNRESLPADPWQRLAGAVTVLFGNPVELPMLYHFRAGQLEFSFNSCLRTYLSLKTLEAIGHAPGPVVLCPGCNDLFTPRKYRGSQYRHWCPKCRKSGARAKAIQRKYDRRKALERQQQPSSVIESKEI